MTEQIKQKHVGIGLVLLGLLLFFPGFWILAVFDDYLPKETMNWLAKGLLPLLVWALPVIGLGYHAWTHGRTVWWAATGWFPVLGPLLGLLALRIDRNLAHGASGRIGRIALALVITLGVPLLVIGMAAPGYRWYHIAKQQHIARAMLENLYKLETRYFDTHKQFGNFDDIQPFTRSPKWYTFRIDVSDEPGTVIPATFGDVTPDNTVVSAGFSAAPAAFTITATANLDFDATLDQWHITDSQPNPVHDVNDRKN